jgi:hypothetical protein
MLSDDISLIFIGLSVIVHSISMNIAERITVFGSIVIEFDDNPNTQHLEGFLSNNSIREKVLSIWDKNDSHAQQKQIEHLQQTDEEYSSIVDHPYDFYNMKW